MNLTAQDANDILENLKPDQWRELLDREVLILPFPFKGKFVRLDLDRSDIQQFEKEKISLTDLAQKVALNAVIPSELVKKTNN